MNKEHGSLCYGCRNNPEGSHIARPVICNPCIKLQDTPEHTDSQLLIILLLIL